jgi:hypothetical protein
MTYPKVMTEAETIAVARSGVSLARFGDGELRLATGVSSSVTQRRSETLAKELREILQVRRTSRLLPCVPDVLGATPRAAFWRPYAGRAYSGMMRPDFLYGNAFITRPDNAPWIDRPDYWQAVRALWAGKSVAYVSGQKTLFDVISPDAARVEVIPANERDAYAQIDELTRHVLRRPYDAVIIALGAAGTVLAARLAGAQHALDLGHIGMFMKNEGAYSFTPEDLASAQYRSMLRQMHETTKWGGGGHNWTEKILKFAMTVKAGQALDYGCGRGTLKPELEAAGLRCYEYDPGIVGKDIPPKLVDLVVSTDVFEHIEPEKVDAVLLHTFRLARKAGFFAIAKQPAKKILPDGRNAHLVCKSAEWWAERLRAAGWPRVEIKEDAWKKCLILCQK